MILYLTTQGSKLSLEEGQVLVSQPDGLLRKIPKEQIESISVFGQIQIQTSVLVHCLTKGISINYYSKKGKYFGRILSTSHGNIGRLKAQIKRSEDPSFCLAIAKNLVRAKVNNQLTLLRRYEKTKKINSEVISKVNLIRKKIDQARDLPSLSGYEGNIAKLYFQGVSKLLPTDFQFNKRSRRPPRDPFNSLISLGYTMLINEIAGNLEAVGLSPYCGFLHQDRPTHPTLASDILEEFRAVLIDSLAVKLLNHKLRREDFIFTEEGVFLSTEALKIFFLDLEKKLSTLQSYQDKENPLTFRKAIAVQVRDLVKAIEEDNPDHYQPLWVR